MAVALPIIGAFEAVAAAGSIAAAMSTVGGFLAVAGGVLTGVGILANDKGLKNFGALMSLGGGIANLATGASSAGEAASSAWDDAASAAQSDAAQFGKYATEGATNVANAPALGTTLGAPSVPTAPTGLEAPAMGAESGGLSLTQRAAERAATTPAATAGDIGSSLTRAAQPLDPVAKAAAGMDSSTMQSILGNLWDKTKAIAGGAGQFVKDNKDLISIIGSAYGPEAEKMNLLNSQFDAQQSLLARRLRNLNSPIRLGQVSQVPGVTGG